MPVKVIAHERAHKEMSGYTENFKERVRNSFKREPEIQAQLNNIIIIPPHLTFTQRAELLYGGRLRRTDLCWRPHAGDQHRLAAGGEGSVLSATSSGWISTRTWRRATRRNGCARWS